MTTTGGDSLTELIVKLREPAPQYVTCCVPAIAIIGAAPGSGLTNKLLWILRCLGCPFTGLFYACCVCNDPIAMSAYWLTSDRFIMKDGKKLSYRPFGHYTMKITDEQDKTGVIKLLEECIAESSILDRLGSLASVYYIFLGIFSALTKAIRIGPCTGEDWTYLPLVLAWTLPAIYKRVFGGRGRMVVKDPRNSRLKDMYIIVEHRESHKKNAQVVQVMITLLFSIVIPWISVLLAYFTRPMSFGCRSRYLTVLSSVWSLNNFIAYISHIYGEQSVEGNIVIHVWFCFCGIIISILLILLSLLSKTKSWWADLFGEFCDVKCKDT